MSNDSRLRVGVIGAGTAYKNLHLPVLSQLGAEVCWLAGTSTERISQAAELSSKAGVGQPEISLDYQSNLQGPSQVDVVLVSVPMGLTGAIALEVAESGNSALVEKPIASTTASAEALIQAFLSRGLTLVVGENFRYQERFHDVRRLVASGVVGEPRLYFLNDLHYTAPDSVYARTEWRTHGGYTGGYLYDGGTHIVAGMRTMVADDVSTVHAVTTAVHPEYLSNAADTMLINIGFARGMVGHLALGYGIVDHEARTPKVYGSEGTLALKPEAIELWAVGGERRVLQPVDKKDTGFGAEWALLVSALSDSAQRDQAFRDAAESVQDLRFLEAALESSTSGQVRRLDQARESAKD